MGAEGKQHARAFADELIAYAGQLAEQRGLDMSIAVIAGSACGCCSIAAVSKTEEEAKALFAAGAEMAGSRFVNYEPAGKPH